MKKSRDAFRTIGEVSDWLETPAHVLRFWETKFTQIRPVKGAGGRRYYRPEDMALLSGIKFLLHEEGMTIKGVQKILREQGLHAVVARAPGRSLPGTQAAPAPVKADSTAARNEAEGARAAPAPPPPADPALPRPAGAADQTVAAPSAAPPAVSDHATSPQPGLLALILRANPARLAAAGPCLAPLVGRLDRVRARMAVE